MFVLVIPSSSLSIETNILYVMKKKDMFLIKLRQNCFYGSYKIEDFMLRGVMCKAHLLTSLNQ